MSAPHPGDAPPPQGQAPLLTRLLPWIDLVAKLLTAVAAALAIRHGL